MATRKDGGHLGTERWQRKMTECVHTTVKRVQVAASGSVADCPAPHAGSSQLRVTDVALLRAGDPGRHPVNVTLGGSRRASVTFGAAIGTNVTFDRAGFASVTFGAATGTNVTFDRAGFASVTLSPGGWLETSPGLWLETSPRGWLETSPGRWLGFVRGHASRMHPRPPPHGERHTLVTAQRPDGCSTNEKYALTRPITRIPVMIRVRDLMM